MLKDLILDMRHKKDRNDVKEVSCNSNFAGNYPEIIRKEFQELKEARPEGRWDLTLHSQVVQDQIKHDQIFIHSKEKRKKILNTQQPSIKERKLSGYNSMN